MIVITATDRHYVEMTGVMLRSLSVNGRLNGPVIVLGDHLRPRHERLLKQAGGEQTQIIDMSAARSAVATFRTTAYWPTAVYFRLLAPDLIRTADRLLHLDGDTLINGSLADLGELPLEGRTVAAVLEKDQAVGVANRRLGRRTEAPYFNSGVMLIDANAWRARGVTAKALAWLDAHPDVFSPDQDALNAVLGEDWLPLDRSYNSHCLGALATHEEISACRIIHFTGRFKPMHAECPHPGKHLYIEHRQHTPWGHRPLQSATRRKLSRLWRKAIQLRHRSDRPQSDAVPS